MSLSSLRVAVGRAANALTAGAGIQTGAISARSRNATTSIVRSMGAIPGDRRIDGQESARDSSGCVKVG